METKLFFVLDRATRIKALAIALEGSSPLENEILSQAGFGSTPVEQREYILLMDIDGGKGTFSYDEYSHGNRSMNAAHKFIRRYWDDLKSGQTIDVESILNENTTTLRKFFSQHEGEAR